MEREKGLVLINTGPGKGKTTAALGSVMRALGQNFKVAFLQFIKNRETGESRFLEEYARQHPGQLYYQRLGLGFVGREPSNSDRIKAVAALARATELMQQDNDLLVLDEFCVALSLGLISLDQALSFLKSRPAGLNLILTGRGCPPEIVRQADTVTEMVVIRHAFETGVPARRGIEF